MRKSPSKPSCACLLVFLSLLAACGGGGGGGGSGGPATYLIGGTISGLAGTVVLQDNGGDDLSLSTNAPFTFATPLADGGVYGVTVRTQPLGQICSVGSGAGTIAGANVTGVSVSCTTMNLVFVTSTVAPNGALGGLAGADAICNARAAAAGLPRTYVAWLSTSTTNAISRLGSSRGWIRRDGLPFVDTGADLAQGIILYPPRLDENGADVVDTTTPVFTGTILNGTVSTNTCVNWTSTTGVGLAGNQTASGTLWTAYAQPSCGSGGRLYCFGVGAIAVLNFAPAPGRRAFLSQASFSATSGIAAADALCQSEATATGQSGTYKALLATTTASAASRFDTTLATWVRPDGVRALASAADLGTTNLTAPINVTASGNYFFSDLVWLGASSFSAVGTSGTTCSDWSSSAPTATTAAADLSGNPTSAFSTLSCGSSAHLYCLQQ